MLHNLRKKREERGLTIKEMSHLLNYKSPSTYAKKEREEIPINIDDAVKISIILGTTIDDLFLNKNYLDKIQNSEKEVKNNEK